jgi:hypothetical protein
MTLKDLTLTEITIDDIKWSLMTSAERVQLAVRFAQMGLEILDREEWIALQNALYSFLIDIDPYQIGSSIFARAGLFPLLPDDLRTIQKDTRQLLEAMLDSRERTPLPPRRFLYIFA